MKAEKRNVRTYKIADDPYAKGLSRGKSNKPLASLLEEVATLYGQGFNIEAVKRNQRQFLTK